MKIVFVSNYFNHHQKPLSDVFFSKIGNDYTFIETSSMEIERKNLGWSLNTFPSYVKKSYLSEETREECKQLVLKADVAIIGNDLAGYEKYRLATDKLTFKYTERINKPMYGNYRVLPRAIKNFCKYKRWDNLYLLCASAYTSLDYKRAGLFESKAYKWGYFPELKNYDDINNVISHKEKNSILWVARFIYWKHPEIPILIAKQLKQAGYVFRLSLIGSGELEAQTRDLIKKENVEDVVELYGAMSPEEVRNRMEKSQIFLFTSDFNEGWGVVLNESMNSGCAVVASHAIGSVPYLIEDGKNGLIYKNENSIDLFGKVKYLLSNPEKSAEFGKKAYETIKTTWNAEIAAERFLQKTNEILKGNSIDNLYSCGPCSKAEIYKNNWYKG